MQRYLTLILLPLLLQSCGDSNVNGFIFVNSEQEEALDVLIQKSEYNYDQGNFDKAQEYGEKALAINEDNEEVRILLGYIYLSQSGIDPIQLSKALIDDSSSDENASLALAGSGAASTLNGLSGITNITEEDYARMGTLTESSIDSFKDFPVIYPDKAPDVREKVSSLTFIAKAIKMACSSVDEEVKVEDDTRHEGDECPESQFEIQNRGRAHFLWAFAHLADALSFNEILQYSTGDESKSNLQKRADSAQTIAESDLGTYADVMNQLSSDISSIMQTDDDDSQLVAVLNGLKAANKAFGLMSGVPKKITDGISKALDSIEAGTSSGDTKRSENQVLKGQLNENVSKGLASKIDKAAKDKPGEFAANKTKLCSTFDNISEGQGNRPNSCSAE